MARVGRGHYIRNPLRTRGVFGVFFMISAHRSSLTYGRLAAGGIMGVLTDVVIAGRDEAQKIGESNVPSKEFPGIDAKGIDQVKIGTLYAILTRTKYDPGFMIDEESFV